MKLTKRLLEAIDKGIQMGLELDDTQEETPIFQNTHCNKVDTWDESYRSSGIILQNLTKGQFLEELHKEMTIPEKILKRFVYLGYSPACKYPRISCVIMNVNNQGEKILNYLRASNWEYRNLGEVISWEREEGQKPENRDVYNLLQFIKEQYAENKDKGFYIIQFAYSPDKKFCYVGFKLNNLMYHFNIYGLPNLADKSFNIEDESKYKNADKSKRLFKAYLSQYKKVSDIKFDELYFTNFFGHDAYKISYHLYDRVYGVLNRAGLENEAQKFRKLQVWTALDKSIKTRLFNYTENYKYVPEETKTVLQYKGDYIYDQYIIDDTRPYLIEYSNCNMSYGIFVYVYQTNSTNYLMKTRVDAYIVFDQNNDLLFDNDESILQNNAL